MKTNEYVCSCKDFVEKVEIPTWEEYFMSMAFIASTRSKDSQTKHGCVITDKKNRILGIGYNSFPVDMPDEILPNVRPKKYKWMVHAERNALSNCSLRPEGGDSICNWKAHVLDCAKAMYQEGVKTFCLLKLDMEHTLWMRTEKTCIFEILSSCGKINVSFIITKF